MDRYECPCGYVYDPENGIGPGTPFEAPPDECACPKSWAEKEFIEKLD